MGGTLPIPRQTTKLHRLQKNLSQWWQTLSRPLQSSNLTNVNERKGTTYISTSSCLRSEQKPILNSDSDSEVRIFGCFVLDPCGSACCATSLNQTYPRRSSTRSTALAASCPVASYSAGSPSKQRAGAPTVPAPASTLAPFGLEDHQVLSFVDSGLESTFALPDAVAAYTDALVSNRADKASDSAPDEADARAATRESADAEVSAEQRQSIPQENQPNPYHRKAEKEKLYPPPMNKYDLDDHIPVGLTRPINPMASPVPVPLERSKTGYSEPIDRSRVYSFSDQFHIQGPCATNSKTTGGRIQCQSQQLTPLTEYRRHSARPDWLLLLGD
ncbi:hypothetical protein VNO77_46808 [Canavalia gladiata]|uniref:Uncharacterized protein n=1 Tax=Canavalia gladiata TaxID=3824 RepID=A0AAN9JFT3_CANGL